MVINLLVLSLTSYRIAVLCLEPSAEMIRVDMEASVAAPPLHHEHSLKAANFYSQESARTSVPEMKENWKKSKDELQSLEKDFNELSNMYLALRNRFQTVQFKAREFPFFFSDLLDIDKSLQKNAVMLALFTQLKIFKLGKINSAKSNLNLIKLLESKNTESLDNQMFTFSNLPEDIVGIIAEKARKNVLDERLLNFKHLLIKTELCFETLDSRSPDTFQLFWTYTFKSVDFLLKNNMAGPSTIQSFFQDTAIITQVLIYVESKFRHAIQRSFSFGSYQLTKHWYWPLLHDSFKALSKREEDLFNAHLLLDSRFKQISHDLRPYFEMFQPPNRSWIRLLSRFFRSFDARRYLEEFEAIIKGKKPKYENELQKNSMTEMIDMDVEALIKLILLCSHQNQGSRNFERPEIVIFFYDVLRFIDQYMCPGIIKRFSFKHENHANLDQIHGCSSNHPTYDNFNDRYNIVLLDFKRADLKDDAERYYSYIQIQKPTDWWKSKLYKLTFDSYLSQLVDAFCEFKTEYSRLMKKPPHLPPPAYLEYCNELKKIKHRFQSAEDNLSIKSRTFST